MSPRRESRPGAPICWTYATALVIVAVFAGASFLRLWLGLWAR